MPSYIETQLVMFGTEFITGESDTFRGIIMQTPKIQEDIHDIERFMYVPNSELGDLNIHNDIIHIPNGLSYFVADVLPYGPNGVWNICTLIKHD